MRARFGRFQNRWRRGRDSNPGYEKTHITVFETAAFNRSATSPLAILTSEKLGGKPRPGFAAQPQRHIILVTETHDLEAE